MLLFLPKLRDASFTSKKSVRQHPTHRHPPLSLAIGAGKLVIAFMTITYEFTESDYVEAQRMHCWRKYSPGTARFFMRWTPVAGAVVLAFGLLLFYLQWDRWVAWAESILGLYAILSTPIAKALLRRRYRRTLIGGNQITLRFEDDALYSDCAGTSSSRMEYTTFKSVRETKEVVLINLAPAIFIAVPRRVLTEDQESELLTFLAGKISPTQSKA